MSTVLVALVLLLVMIVFLAIGAWIPVAIAVTSWIGLVVFGPETSVGIVQLFFDQMVQQLAAAAPRDQPAAPVLPENFEHELDASLKALFGR